MATTVPEEFTFERGAWTTRRSVRVGIGVGSSPVDVGCIEPRGVKLWSPTGFGTYAHSEVQR